MKRNTIIIIFFLLLAGGSIVQSCVSTRVADKSGAQLWGENCLRCHSTPSPADFSDAQWETIGTHMKMRANLTNEEAKKIFEFLQSAN